MLEKLQELEQVLAQLNTQYNVLATELANLKNKSHNDAKSTATINELLEKLGVANQNNEQLQSQLADSLTQKDKQSALHADEIAKLNKQNQELSNHNDELEQKVELALERIKTLETWLHNIDAAKNATS